MYGLQKGGCVPLAGMWDIYIYGRSEGSHKPMSATRFCKVCNAEVPIELFHATGPRRSTCRHSVATL